MRRNAAMITDFLADWYLVIKALHVISVIAWMAGLFYLPRLFVYHVEQVRGRAAAPTRCSRRWSGGCCGRS